jgi:predicted amidophosphoribosyltransferase
MRALPLRQAASGLLAPPLCAACGAACVAGEPLCDRCSGSLAAATPGRRGLTGVGPLSWVAPYDGIAGRLVGALKFHARLGLAPVIGEALARLAVQGELGGAAVVAVPAAPRRRRLRGFDPAELIAASAARRLELDLAMPLRRADGPRQVGRRRTERLATPPRVRAVAEPPRAVLLVDDVLTTGATLRACATALRGAGTVEIQAAVFARALGAGEQGA